MRKRFPPEIICATCLKNNVRNFNIVCPACGRIPDTFRCHFCGQPLRQETVYCPGCVQRFVRDIRYVEADRRLTPQQAETFDRLIDEALGGGEATEESEAMLRALEPMPTTDDFDRLLDEELGK